MCSFQCSQTHVILGVMLQWLAAWAKCDVDCKCVYRWPTGAMVCVASNFSPRCRGGVCVRDMCERVLNLSVPSLFRRRRVGFVPQEQCGISFPTGLTMWYPDSTPVLRLLHNSTRILKLCLRVQVGRGWGGGSLTSMRRRFSFVLITSILLSFLFFSETHLF